MSRLVRWINPFLVAMAGVIAGASIGLFLTPEQGRAAGPAYVYGGYGTKCEPRGGSGHPCWHFDEVNFTTFGGIDLHNGLGAGDNNQPVYWIQGGTSWSNVVSVRFEAVTATACTGIRVVLTNGLAGAFHYKQVQPLNNGVGLYGTDLAKLVLVARLGPGGSAAGSHALSPAERELPDHGATSP